MKKSSGQSIHFPFSQTVKIAVLSLRIRWQRSLLVGISLVLAISFFAYTVSTIMFCNSIVVFDRDPSFPKLCSQGTNIVAGASSRDIWLIAMSLLICLAGITNAQLMAVTERFREIGTFKCLGALDRFIVNLLVVETCIYGFFGGVIGGLTGIFTALVSFSIKAGWSNILKFSLNMIGVPIMLSVLVSTILSLMGVIYPAILAARMEPSIALKYEE
mgnify:CR=1 FL=1